MPCYQYYSQSFSQVASEINETIFFLFVVCLYETENTTCPSFCKYIVLLENLSPNQTAFFLTGAAGSSCQAQKAFSNWSLLPHLWPGDLHVRTGVGLYLRLSLLLYTSGQFSFSLLFCLHYILNPVAQGVNK